MLTPLCLLLVHDEKVRRGTSAKLPSPYIGPYEIIDIDDVNVTEITPEQDSNKSS